MSINYSPENNYQDELDSLMALKDNNELLSTIEIQETEDSYIDARALNKSLNNISKDFDVYIDNLMENLRQKIYADFKNKSQIYTFLVSKGIEEDPFPLDDWVKVVNSYEFKNMWKIDFSLNEVNNFEINNFLKQFLSIENSYRIIKLIQKDNFEEIKISLNHLKSYYSGNEVFNNLYDYVIFSDITEVYAVMNKSLKGDFSEIVALPPLKEKKWTSLAAIELVNNWEESNRKEELLTLLSEKGSQEDKEWLIKKVLLDVKQAYSDTFKFEFRMRNKLVKEINWSCVEELFSINKRYQLNVENTIIDTLREVIKRNKFNLTDKDSENKLEYFVLNLNLSERDLKNKKNKI